MTWPPDVPSFPIKKPHTIEKLEKLPKEILNAMTFVEMEEKIRDAAVSLAHAYNNLKTSREVSYEECVLYVSGALTETGGDINNELGERMIGESQSAASHACREFFPDELS